MPEKPSHFEELIEDFLQAIQQHQFETYANSAYELYQYLLQPLEMYLMDPAAVVSPFSEKEESANSNIPQLIVIPHGILSYVPFEALVCSSLKSAKVDAETSNPYQCLDYLLLHCKVNYHYSATLWHYLLKTKRKRVIKDNVFVGFAPVYQSENEQTQELLTAATRGIRNWATRSEAVRSDGTWTPLPHSKVEAEQIAALFAQKSLPSRTFLHEQATKKQFRAAAEKSHFLLIAAHGVVNDKHPKLSGLVFYPETTKNPPYTSPPLPLRHAGASYSKGELAFRDRMDGGQESHIKNRTSEIKNHTSSDCILSMEETYHLNLQADLVVLSSCESGIGQLAEGEGMMAVNRGFLFAGAKNVVSTLFKVYDKPSSLLTQYLFEGVLEGKDYAEALRAAKLRLLKLEKVDVKSWSGFVLIGGG